MFSYTFISSSDSSTGLGIGTTSPSEKLHIIDTSNPVATSGSVIIEGRRDGGANVLTLRAKDASAPSSALPAGQGAVLRWQGFDGTDFENMGYIYVASDGQAVANADAPSYMSFGTSGDGSSTPTERMRIDSSGNVTIKKTDSFTYSNTTPVSDLVIERKNTDNTNNETVGIRFAVTGWSGSTTGGAAIQAIQTSNVSSADLAFLTRNAGTFGERMRINSSGGQTWNMSNATVSISGSTGGNVTLSNTTGTWAFRANGSSVNSMTITSSKITLNEFVDVSNDLTINNSSPELYFKTGSTHYRWMIAAQENVDGALEITPSTTAGGSTYNSPVAVFKATGNVGIANTSPDEKLEISGDGGTNYPHIKLSNPGQTGRYLKIGMVDSVNHCFESNGGGTYQTFKTASIERMRITSGGDVCIGTTTGRPDSASDAGVAITPAGKFYIYSTSDFGVYNSNSTGTKIYYRLNGGALGSISYNASSVSYNTTSDYRLKEDLQDFNGLDKISQIPVYDFKWKKDESRSYGVMAHELQKVLPEAVIGEKDAEEMQGVDYSKIVPLLVKSIQELKAEIELLKTQINN